MFDYRKFNQITLLELEADIDWMNFISKHDNVNDQWNEIQERLRELIKICIPHRTITISTTDKLLKATKSGNRNDFSTLVTKHGSAGSVLSEIAENLKTIFGDVSEDRMSLVDDNRQLRVTENEVRHHLKCFQRKKSPGIDGISAEIYSLLSDQLSQPLTAIFNESLQQRFFPNE